MRGINFTEPLFHLVVSGEKTQTRRIIKPQPDEKGTVKPRYKRGETLYLKEPYATDVDIAGDDYVFKMEGNILYKYSILGFENSPVKWKNKLFMPEKYARYYIKISGVRVERLQDVSDADCQKEGVFKHISHAGLYWKNGFDGLMYGSPRIAYAWLINAINSKGTWESNPFVWVYDFQLTKK
jgi:hypothetical protein